MEKRGTTQTVLAGLRGAWGRKSLIVLLLPLVSALAGCASGKKWNYLPATQGEERSIYVIAHGWHAGIALSSEDLEPELGFVRGYLRPGRYYEFGWGEADFYQADKVTPAIFLKAVFWRNPSVMHVFSMPVAPPEQYKGGDVVELKLSGAGLKHLKDKLRTSFTIDAAGRPSPLKAGPHGEDRFFKAEGYYLITHTCNTWTAKVLESGGVPMDTVFTLRSASVMRQVKKAREEYRRLRPFGPAEPPSASSTRIDRRSEPFQTMVSPAHL